MKSRTVHLKLTDCRLLREFQLAKISTMFEWLSKKQWNNCWKSIEHCFDLHNIKHKLAKTTDEIFLDKWFLVQAVGR